MFPNFNKKEDYDSSIPSDLLARNNAFQRAALLSMKHKLSIDTSKDVSEMLGIGDSTNAKLGQKQNYLYELDERLYEDAPPPPNF